MLYIKSSFSKIYDKALHYNLSLQCLETDFTQHCKTSSSMNECKISYVCLRVTSHLTLNKRFKLNFRLTLQWHLRVILCSITSSWRGGVIYFKCTLVFIRVEALRRVCGLKPKPNPGNPLCRWPICPVHPWQSHQDWVRWHTLAFQIIHRTFDTTEFVFLKVTLKCLLMWMRCWKRKERRKKERKGGGKVGGGREGRHNMKWYTLSPKKTRKQHNQKPVKAKSGS